MAEADCSARSTRVGYAAPGALPGRRPRAPTARQLPHGSRGPPAPTYPLAVVGCPGCTVVQLSGPWIPRAMFDNYLYLSSYSTSMVRRCGDSPSRPRAGSPRPDDLVVEVASNDGYLLRHYGEPRCSCARDRTRGERRRCGKAAGIETVVAYFTPEVRDGPSLPGPAAPGHACQQRPRPRARYPRLRRGDPSAFRPRAVWPSSRRRTSSISSTPNFETIYHEHVFYYSLTALVELFGAHGMVVEAYQPLQVHGGSLRVTVRNGAPLPYRRAKSPPHSLPRPPGPWLRARLLASSSAEVMRREPRYRPVRQDQGSGQSLAGYGAAAKATVLLNFAGIDSTTIGYVVDKNPAKQGRIIPGTGIAVVSRRTPPHRAARRGRRARLEPRSRGARADGVVHRRTAAKLVVPLENRRAP